MTKPSPSKDDETPDVGHLHEALTHIESGVRSGSITVGAAKGLLYSLTETLGVIIGDPDLPEHAKSGYEGLLEVARELRVKLKL
jgi:hypothetical protein